MRTKSVRRNGLMNGQRVALVGLVRREDWSRLTYAGAARKASRELGFRVTPANYRSAASAAGREWKRKGRKRMARSTPRRRQGNFGEVAKALLRAALALAEVTK
jgi:hypothetical protein